MLVTPHLHAADEPEHVRSPAVTHVSVNGTGSPGTDEFYRKKALVGDIARQLNGGEEPVIEIRYRYPAGSVPVEIADFYSVNPVSSLLYRVLAVVPDDTSTDEVAAARLHAASSSGRSGDSVELQTTPEQDVVQVMHHGPFAEEFATLGRLGSFARELGLRRSGAHHELHLDAFTRDTPQDHLRTILRDPVV